MLSKSPSFVFWFLITGALLPAGSAQATPFAFFWRLFASRTEPSAKTPLLPHHLAPSVQATVRQSITLKLLTHMPPPRADEDSDTPAPSLEKASLAKLQLLFLQPEFRSKAWAAAEQFAQAKTPQAYAAAVAAFHQQLNQVLAALGYKQGQAPSDAVTPCAAILVLFINRADMLKAIDTGVDLLASVADDAAAATAWGHLARVADAGAHLQALLGEVKAKLVPTPALAGTPAAARAASSSPGSIP